MSDSIWQVMLRSSDVRSREEMYTLLTFPCCTDLSVERMLKVGSPAKSYQWPDVRKFDRVGLYKLFQVYNMKLRRLPGKKKTC